MEYMLDLDQPPMGRLADNLRAPINGEGERPLAPRAAIVAALAFGGADDVLTYLDARDNRATWHLVALGGLGLITVDAEHTNEGWSWGDDQTPDDRPHIAATCWPLASIVRVDLLRPSVKRSGRHVTIQTGWTVTVRDATGDHQIDLSDLGDANDPDRVTRFARLLFDRMRRAAA